MKKLKKNKGLTLVELIVTIALLAVVMGMIVGSYGSVYRVFADTSRTQDAKQMLLSLSTRIREEVRYATFVKVSSGSVSAGGGEEGQPLYALEVNADGRLEKRTLEAGVEASAEEVFPEGFYGGMTLEMSFSSAPGAAADGQETLLMTLTLMDGTEAAFSETYAVKLYNIEAGGGAGNFSVEEGGGAIAYQLYTPD